MFDKFAARDAKSNSGSKSSLRQNGKDVFTRAEEEAEKTFGDKIESTVEGKNRENKSDTSTMDNDKVNDGMYRTCRPTWLFARLILYFKSYLQNFLIRDVLLIRPRCLIYCRFEFQAVKHPPKTLERKPKRNLRNREVQLQNNCRGLI